MLKIILHTSQLFYFLKNDYVQTKFSYVKIPGYSEDSTVC